MTNKKIRVLLCDDHAVLRAGLRALLSSEPDIDIIADVGRGEAAVEQAAALSPDVVIMDLSLPGIDGLEATRRIREQAPSCNVLILTMHKQMHYMMGALKAGASGYVLKSDVDAELVGAIRAVHQGGAFIYSADTKAVFQVHLEQGGSLVEAQQLSAMEDKVLRLTARGHTSKEIAEQLAISASTVDTYRFRIMNKLGLSRRSDLVQWATDHGLLAP